MKTYDFDPRKLPAEYAAAIGRVTAASAFCEKAVQDAIAGVAGLSMITGWALTTHVSAPVRDNMLMSIARLHLRDERAIAELEGLLAEVKSVTKVRNDLVHSGWAIEDGTGKVGYWLISSRGTLKGRFVPISVTQIEAHALALYDAGLTIVSFLINWNVIPFDGRPPAR